MYVSLQKSFILTQLQTFDDLHPILQKKNFRNQFFSIFIFELVITRVIGVWRILKSFLIYSFPLFVFCVCFCIVCFYVFFDWIWMFDFLIVGAKIFFLQTAPNRHKRGVLISKMPFSHLIYLHFKV